METKNLSLFNWMNRRGSGANLNLFRSVAIVLLCVLGVSESAWAGGGSSKTYYATMNVAATGSGTVYVNASGTTSQTKSASSTSSSTSISFNIYATANAGYKFSSWSGSGITFGSTTTANTTGSISTSSTSSPGTSKTATATFDVIKVTAAPADVTINATEPSATYPDAAGVVVGFTTSSSNANSDFTTGGSGDSRWTISAWPTHASATSTTFNYKFVGNGSYGTNNRTFTKTVTLKGLNDATVKTCTLTAKYPNPRVVACDAEATDLTIYPTFKAADATQAAVEKTAVFDVVYADNGNNFSAAFSGATGSGTWTVTGISVDQNNQKATVTYTFNGNKSAGTHTAVLTLTANNCQGWDDTSAAGGASATVTLTAENTQEATNDASVTTTANVTTEYATFAEALAAANATSGATLTLLRNVDLGTITATNNITKAMTIDLNGKELRAAVNATSVGILTITKAVAVTIKDSKTGGRIINEIARNSEIRTIFVNKAGATLTLESGTLAVNNTGQYASAANSTLGVAKYASCAARVIHQIAGATVNINGGRVEAIGTREVYGIVQASSAATNAAGTSVLNITGGEIYAEAPYSAYGICAYGKVNMSAGVINTHINTNMVNAYYAADNANNTSNGNGYGIYMQVSVSATASSCYYGTLNMTGGTINVISDRKKAASLYNYGIHLNAAATGVGAGKTATDGTLSQKACAKASIENATINVHSGTYYSYGINVLGSYNSYDNTYFTVPIKNSTIDVKAYTYTYGVVANCGINSTYGGKYWGDVELTGNTLTAESVTGSTAYGVYVVATTAHIFKDANTTTAPNYFGEYATAAKAVINSGTYTAKTKTSSAYAVCSSTRAKTIYDPETTVQTNRKPSGAAEAYPIIIIHGGTFRGETTTSTSRAVSSGGYTTIDGGTFEAFSTTTTAYGLYAVSGKLTASGVTISANATQYAYGALADCAVPSGNTAQTGFAYAGELELNNCDITATTRTSTEARGVFVNATNKMHTWAGLKSDSTSNKWATTTYNAYKSVFPCTVAGHDSVGIAIAAKATINGCDIKATAATTTAYGIYSTATSVPASADSVASPIVNIKNTKFTVKTDGTTTAYGVYAGGPTTIDGCDFTVLPKTTTAYGVYIYDKKTTITNTKFDVKGTTTAYGIYANAALGSTTGWDYHGEVELGEGNDMTVAATAGNTSHVLTLIAAKKNVASGRFAGDYANAASALITGGKYKATATGTTSYVLNLSAQQVQGSAVSQPSCTIEGGKFWALASGGTTGVCTTNGVAGNILFKGGVYNVNTTLSKHIPEGYEEVPLASDRPEYTEGYRYEVGEAGMHGIDVCQIGSTKYKTLEEALQVVTSGQTIYMIANYIMNTPGDYILPSGATLLIPYKTGSGAGATTAIGNSAKTNSSGTTPTLFRKLTFGNGVNLTCFGTIETSAEQKCNGQYGACAGMPSGAYGQIHLEEGSHISMEANSRLNCWGYITGKGTINVKKNAIVLEDFQLGDWCGGTNASTLNNNSQKVFPITHYFYQNIECPITYRPGSKALGSSHIYASSTVAGQDAVALVGVSGSGALFLMDNNDESADTWVMKDYDETTDQCVWTMNSGATIGNLNINLTASWLSYNFTSANYDLPITTNMTIILNNGEMGLSQNTVFLPGSKLIVNKQGTLAINGINVVAYDVADWTGTTRYYASYSPTWGTTNPRKNIAVQSADFFLHGKVNIKSNGGLYTTASGANVHSTNEDAGEVIYTTAAQGNKTNHYYLQQGGTTRTNITIYPAKLKNTDGSYASSAGTTSGKTWTFKNDIWDAWSKDGCFFMNAQDEPHAKPAALVQLTSKTPDANHLHHDAATGTRNFVWDENCYWWEVSTIPTAEGYYLSLNADNNGDYNYYYYDNAAACWKIKKITITWNINGTTTNYSVGYGTKPEWLGATPTKTSSSSDYVWRWDGWTKGSDATVIANNDLPFVTENTTFTAHFYEKYYEYNVTFKNSDGTILDSRNWRAGTTPSYEGTPTKNATVDYTYEFNGTWSPAITTVTGSATYTAQYTATPRQYNVEFVNYDMSVLGTTKVDYNATPTTATYRAAIAPSDFEPYKPDNSAYSFNFSGWRLNGASSNGFAQVKGDQTYVAQFAETTKKYRISFVDEDGETVLHWAQLEYDAMPSYDGPATSGFNKQDAEWTYVFTGWTPATFSQVKGPQTYVANYDKTKREYTITWKDGDGNTLTTSQVAYGETPAYSGATPTKTSTSTHSYVFNNTWSPAIVAVTGEATYTAQFNETERIYALTIGVNNAEFGSVSPASVTGIPYNAAVTVNGNKLTVNGTTVTATPTAATAQYTYAFSSWSNVPSNVTADVSNTQAVFTRTLNTYTVTFNDYNGAELKKQTVDWNTAATAPSNPSREGYTFTGWDKAFNAVTADLVVTAQYSINKYKVTFDSNGGSAVSTIEQNYNTAVTAPADPTREGYTFNGWSPAVPSVMPASNTNCVAQWTINKYKVTFDSNGGSAESTIEQNYNTAVTAPADPTREGYTFAGWSPVVPSTMPASNTNCVAQWTINQYNLIVATNNNDWGAVTGGGKYDYNTSHEIKATPATGYKFVQWNDGNTNATRNVTIPAEDVTYTATFEADIANYTVKHWQQNIYDDNYTEVTDDRQILSGKVGSATVAVAKTTYTGFTTQAFEQGTIAGDGSTVVDIYYNRNTYTITWVDGDGITIETDEQVKYGATPTYDGATPTKTQTVEWVYTHDGWTPAVEAVTGNATYTATFGQEKRKYNVTWTGEGVVERTDEVEYGETPSYGVEPTKDPDTRWVYTFAWQNTSNWEIGIQPVTGNVTYAGSFTGSPRPYTITFVNDNGTELQSSSVGYGSQPQYTGSTPVSTENADFEFIGWTPEITEVGGDATYVATYLRIVPPIVVEADETIMQNTTTTTTTVRVTGRLSVESSATLTTDDLILEGTPNSSGEIVGEGTVAAAQHAYYDLTKDGGFKAKTWYAVAVPWQVDVPAYDKAHNGVYAKEAGGAFAQQELGRSYDLIYYDGGLRAAEGHSDACWKYIEDDAKAEQIMYPGRAYMIYFPRDVETIRFERKADASLKTTTLAVEAHSSSDNRNAGWNGIANPSTYHAYINPNTLENNTYGGVNYGQLYDGDNWTYQAINLDEQSLVVGQPVYVQVAATNSSVVAYADHDAAFHAPRRAKANAMPILHCEVGIAPSDGTTTDRVIVRTLEDKENAYVIAQDLMKMGVSTRAPQMWVDRYDSRLCINTVAPTGKKADYPLGILVPNEGSYAIAQLAEMNTNASVYLTYNGRAIWNLGYGPYETYLPQGTNTQYGLRIVYEAPQLVTGVDEATIENGEPVRKVMMEDKVYIIRNGEMYSVTGAKVK